MAGMVPQTRSLVLAAGSLGDSLLTLPALRILENQGPVTVAGTPPYLALGADLFGVSQMIPLAPLLQALLKPEPPSQDVADFISSFEKVFLFFKERDEKLTGKFSGLGPEPVRVPLRSFEDFLSSARWAGEFWLETALQRPVASEDAFLQAKLIFQDAQRERGKEILKGLGLASPLVIHPGSGSPSKNAPLSFFQKAAQRAVEESGKQVLVIWGEAETEWLGEIQNAFKGLKGVQMLDEPLPLRDLAFLFTQAAAYLGNDSGVTHLANACGVKTFAVFNSTDSRIWGPQTDIFILHWLKGNLG
jgi:hypothetical protein